MRQTAISRRVVEKVSFFRQLIAGGLLLMIAFFVVDPLWESRDHLDNLRHLGPHGVLFLLLLVACAGITLLKVMRWLSPLCLGPIRFLLRPDNPVAPSAAAISPISLAVTPPPLLI